jgi:hypothetical protein
VWTPPCPGELLSMTSTAPCVPSAPLTFTGPGTFYLMVYGGDVGCFDKYLLTIAGPGIPPCGPTGTEPLSWGRVKGLHR